MRKEPTIKELRQLAGMTQKQMSEYTGINLKTLRSWEQDIRHPMNGFIDILYRLMKAENIICESRPCNEGEEPDVP